MLLSLHSQAHLGLVKNMRTGEVMRNGKVLDIQMQQDWIDDVANDPILKGRRSVTNPKMSS